ncbi:hypothetical protein COCNU_14G013040, partial [Cocos nucifera]
GEGERAKDRERRGGGGPCRLGSISAAATSLVEAKMKTTKGGRAMNPTDAYRKELRKKELKRNKKERKKVREVGILKKDPDAIREQINKLEMMSK